ncbi:hypothetical protein B0T18DRAFT_448963 [Schizothecium vesticola]|uniref:Uncharacterized protein n=1 Tax=Schizothecium vesticola TaxID=314040 RepID=A0AA40EJ48_9PEZI|nr:hypothetical protein B0T18DRAFT_448963 [Schizothecium vesticola]
MPSPSTTLPAPRSILNALLSRIATIPLPSPVPPASNPLALTPPSHRHLIITLHVLFPALLLPALDLLDRRLLARIALDDSLSYRPRPHTRHLGQGDGKVGEGQATFYLVSSSVAPVPPRRDAAAVAARFYVVRVGTWHFTPELV